MKIRDGFVSNSSSSSFTIPINKLTDLQRFSIINHGSFAGEGAWSIDERDGCVIGTTTSHRFNMERFLENLGVDDKYVTWEHT